MVASIIKSSVKCTLIYSAQKSDDIFRTKIRIGSLINKLFAFCKGGNFNIHIWAWFGYFICLGREIRFYHNLVKSFGPRKRVCIS